VLIDREKNCENNKRNCSQFAKKQLFAYDVDFSVVPEIFHIILMKKKCFNSGFPREEGANE